MKQDTVKLVLVAGILFFIGSKMAGTTGPLSVLLCLLGAVSGKLPFDATTMFSFGIEC